MADYRKASLPSVLPAGWRRIQERPDGAAFLHGTGLAVIAGDEQHAGRWWRHVSISRPDRLPSWSDLKDVKALFIGRERPAYQVLPPESEYVNFHPYCLHLWHALEGPTPLPDFTRGMGML